MEFFTNNVTLSYFLAGAVLMLLEALLFPGVGCLYAGLAAITTGALLQFNILDVTDYSTQVAVFFTAVFLWAAILWVPLKNFQKQKNGGKFNSAESSDIVGQQAVVYSRTLNKGEIGEAKFSGTIMRAKISENSSNHSFKSGDTVDIIGIEGNVLIIRI